MKKIIILGISVLAFSCSDSLDEEESSQAFSATQLVLAQGSATAGASSTGPADTLGVNHSFICLEGGAATFAGSIETSTDGNSAFKYKVDFDGCVSRGITMDGSLDYDLSFEKTGEQSFNSVFSFTGDLEYSGEVDGSCTMDLVATTSLNQTGASFSYVGNLCGNDAKTSMNQSFNFSDINIPTF